MNDLSSDETEHALRRLCGRYFDEVASTGAGAETAHSLPDGVVHGVTAPASGADGDLLSIRLSPDFYLYLAGAAEYWAGLFARHAFLHAKGSGDAYLELRGYASI